MPKATAVFDADDSRLCSALARINGKMRALQSRLTRFAAALIGGSRSIRSSFSLNAKHWSRRKLALPITLQFTRDIKGLRDERTGKDRGNGWEFVFDWKQNEAVVVSFDSR